MKLERPPFKCTCLAMRCRRSDVSSSPVREARGRFVAAQLETTKEKHGIHPPYISHTGTIGTPYKADTIAFLLPLNRNARFAWQHIQDLPRKVLETSCCAALPEVVLVVRVILVGGVGQGLDGPSGREAEVTETHCCGDPPGCCRGGCPDRERSYWARSVHGSCTRRQGAGVQRENRATRPVGDREAGVRGGGRGGATSQCRGTDLGATASWWQADQHRFRAGSGPT